MSNPTQPTEHDKNTQAIRSLSLTARKPAATESIISAFDLPESLAARCDEISRRTRLRTKERREIARELAAHCADALEAGRTESDILATMGEPKPVAKLLRRGMLRKRHPIEQAFRFAAKATGLTFAALAIFYTAFAIRFYTGEPTIKTSYIAQINERPQSLPEDQRAWPLYLDAYLTLRQAKLDLEQTILEPRAEADFLAARETDPDARRRSTGIDDPFLNPNHPDYEDIARLYAKHAEALNLMRQATAKPGFGFEYGFETPLYNDDVHATAYTFKPYPADPAEQPSLINALLPHLGSLRAIARDLAFQALHAARAGDSQAALENLIAMSRLTRQTTEEPFLIGYLVGVAIGALTDETVIRTIHEDPDLYSAGQLATLAHALAARGHSQISNALATDSYFFDDFLQRAYTDSGSGHGRVTKDAFFAMGDNPFNISENDYKASVFPIIALPAIALITADRQSLKHEYDLYFQRARAATQLDTPAMVRSISEIEHDFQLKSSLHQIRSWPLYMILPAVARAAAADKIAHAQLQATLAMIAATAHRTQTGQWPETLEEITPKLLPKVPDDPFNPGHKLIYKLTDTGPVLYSVGENAIDDNATQRPTHPNGRFRRTRPDLMKRYMNIENAQPGDFILYPPAELNANPQDTARRN